MPGAAWSPSEGQYDLDWLDRAVTAAAKHGIVTVIGTPSAAPPAWLTQKYPETLRTMEDGRRDQHGNRQQFNFANPKYRELARRWPSNWPSASDTIRTSSAGRSTTNTPEVSFDAETKAAIPAVAQSTATARSTTSTRAGRHRYWSETYFDWDQVPIQVGYGNPGLLLSWMRFVSDTWRSYQKNQLEVIRANADPRQFITTNMMGWFDGYDHYTVAQDLDLAAWDDYVGQGHLDPVRNGAAHDLTRGFKGKNFWVMETQPAA